MKRSLAAAALLCLLLPGAAPAQRAKKADAKPAKGQKDAKEEKKEVWSAGTFAGLELRSIGPALTSGRVVDLAVHPTDRGTYYVAVASGGVWKTTNAGTTWSRSSTTRAPTRSAASPSTRRTRSSSGSAPARTTASAASATATASTSRSTAARRWKNVGLQDSEHIGKILIDPRNSNVVYVAAQGPLWAPGGDRGLYKTTDGGKTWKQVLAISENTGVTDVVFDPRDPDVLYAAAYQRRRHVWTLINGGPESAHPQVARDGGATWTKLTTGLPKEELGRIGLAVSPADPDVVYAIIEAAGKAGGFFRSPDGGATWEKTQRLRQRQPAVLPASSSPTRRTSTASTRWTSRRR